jgi:hypothetical protein
MRTFTIIRMPGIRIHIILLHPPIADIGRTIASIGTIVTIASNPN